jgi:hypothetical protein
MQFIKSRHILETVQVDLYGLKLYIRIYLCWSESVWPELRSGELNLFMLESVITYIYIKWLKLVIKM